MSCAGAVASATMMIWWLRPLIRPMRILSTRSRCRNPADARAGRSRSRRLHSQPAVCQMICTAAHDSQQSSARETAWCRAAYWMHSIAIAGGVKTDGVIRAADIIINGTRNADDARNTAAGKRLCTAECTVTAAADQAVNTEVTAGVSRLLQTFLGQHFLAACGVQHGAALADNAVYTAGTHLDDVTVDETAVAAANAKNGNIVCACAADYRAISAFMPGASPPLVSTPILRICLSMIKPPCCRFCFLSWRHGRCRTDLCIAVPSLAETVFLAINTVSYCIITSSSRKRKRNFVKNAISGLHQYRRAASVFFFVSIG